MMRGGSALVAIACFVAGFGLNEWRRGATPAEVAPANASAGNAQGPSAEFTQQSRAIIEAYLREPVKKLQIGAGTSRLPGWLNTDIEAGEGLAYLDASKRFPFEDDTFRYITSEHVIEHLAYEEGQVMIAESFRVMEPGGTVRIATPNLRRFIDLFDPVKSDQVKAYIDGKLAWHEWPKHRLPETIILNLQLSSWGHRFTYDQETLREALLRVGFTDIREFGVGQSDDPDLRGLEFRSQGANTGLNAYETMVLEARKPSK